MKTLVLDLFGLNPAFLGCYGNDWIATPTIDTLAAAGIVFDHHYIETPTLPDHDSPSWSSIVSQLRESDRVHFHGPSLAAPWTLPDDLMSLYTEDEDVKIAPWTDRAMGELTTSEDILRVQDTYAAAVTAMDAQLARLLEAIDEEPWADELTLVLTASSGYPLGEHGRLGWDRPWLYEELVHVPLIVLPPVERFAGERVMGITQPADLSQDLSTLIQGDGRPFAVSSWRLGDRAELSLRTKEWALILPMAGAEGDPPRARQLFTKPDDRWEVNDVAAQYPDLADELERTLRETVK